jgi:hypothetical protein
VSGNEDRLDRLLRAPLDPIADNGFSARVMAKMARADARHSWLESAVLAIAAGLLLAILSTAGFAEWVARISDSLANSVPLAVAAFALALTLLFARALAE